MHKQQFQTNRSISVLAVLLVFASTLIIAQTVDVESADAHPPKAIYELVTYRVIKTRIVIVKHCGFPAPPGKCLIGPKTKIYFENRTARRFKAWNPPSGHTHPQPPPPPPKPTPAPSEQPTSPTPFAPNCHEARKWDSGSECIKGSKKTSDGEYEAIIGITECTEFAKNWPNCDEPTEESKKTVKRAGVTCWSWTPVQHNGHAHRWFGHDSDKDGVNDVCTYPHECGCTGINCHKPCRGSTGIRSRTTTTSNGGNNNNQNNNGGNNNNQNNNPPAKPTVGVRVSVSTQSPIAEGQTAWFDIDLNNANPSRTSSVYVNITVTATGDYLDRTFRAAGNHQLAFRVGTNSRSFSLRTVNDRVEEAKGRLTVTVRPGSGYTVNGSAKSASVDVLDDDATPKVSITAGSDVNEGVPAGFTLRTTPSGECDVNVMVSGATGFHAHAGRKRVTVFPSGVKNFSIPTIDDKTDEPDGVITAQLQTATKISGSSVVPCLIDSNKSSASLTIRDNDVIPVPVTLAVAQERRTVTEGDSDDPVVVKATLASPATRDIEVPVIVKDGTAKKGADYDLPEGAVHISITRGSSYGEFIFETVDDKMHETDETLTVALGALESPYSRSGPSEVTITIKDNDAKPTEAQISIEGSPVVTEPKAGSQTRQQMTAKVTLKGDTTFSHAVAVKVQIGATGTAEKNKDYSHRVRDDSFQVLIDPGKQSGSKTFDLTLKHNPSLSDKTILLTEDRRGSNPQDSLTTVSPATITIKDSTQPYIKLTIASGYYWWCENLIDKDGQEQSGIRSLAHIRAELYKQQENGPEALHPADEEIEVKVTVGRTSDTAKQNIHYQSTTIVPSATLTIRKGKNTSNTGTWSFRLPTLNTPPDITSDITITVHGDSSLQVIPTELRIYDDKNKRCQNRTSEGDGNTPEETPSNQPKSNLIPV